MTKLRQKLTELEIENQRLLRMEQSQNQIIAAERQNNRRKLDQYEKQAKIDYDLIVQRDAKINDFQSQVIRLNREVAKLNQELTEVQQTVDCMDLQLNDIEDICISEEWRARNKIRMIIQCIHREIQPKTHGSEANGQKQQ